MSLDVLGSVRGFSHPRRALVPLFNYILVKQSDRLVDLLLPVDSIVTLLAQAVEGVSMDTVSHSQLQGLAAAAAAHVATDEHEELAGSPLDVEAVLVGGLEWMEDRPVDPLGRGGA